MDGVDDGLLLNESLFRERLTIGLFVTALLDVDLETLSYSVPVDSGEVDNVHADTVVELVAEMSAAELLLVRDSDGDALQEVVLVGVLELLVEDEPFETVTHWEADGSEIVAVREGVGIELRDEVTSNDLVFDRLLV